MMTPGQEVLGWAGVFAAIILLCLVVEYFERRHRRDTRWVRQFKERR